MNNLNYVPLGANTNNPKEGKKAICFNVDLSATTDETVDIGLGIKEISQVRSIYLRNLDTVSNLTVTVASTGQIIKCSPGNIVYVPLFSSMPCRLLFHVDVLATKFIQVIVGNFDFDTIKPNGSALTNVIISGGAVITGGLVVDSITLGGSPLRFQTGGTPVGVIDGVNPTFTLPQTPVDADAVMLFLQGIKLKRGVGYTIAANVITFLAGYIPQIGDTVENSPYRY